MILDSLKILSDMTYSIHILIKYLILHVIVHIKIIRLNIHVSVRPTSLDTFLQLLTVETHYKTKYV